MRFTIIVMQLTGEITDRQKCSGAKVRQEMVGRKLISAFHVVLAHHPVPTVGGPVLAFRWPMLQGERGELIWRQTDPFSAFAMINLDRRPVLTCMFLSGFDSICDQAAVEGIQPFCLGVLGTTPETPGQYLQGVCERPVAVFIPLPPTLGEFDHRIVNNLAVSLGAAFFEKASASLSPSDLIEIN